MTKDPATGRPATPAASRHAERVHQTVFSALDAAGVGRAEAQEIADAAYQVALFRYDHPFVREN
jgi:hypothetical protein